VKSRSLSAGACRAPGIFWALRLDEVVRYETSTDRLPLTVNFAAVSNPENSYKFPRIINLIDHSVIADPNSPVVLGAN
jgi:hypothetical protein